MIVFDAPQSALSFLQGVPVVGPVVVSPVKAVFSIAQMITGLIIGIFAGMAATGSASLGLNNLARPLAVTAGVGFLSATKGYFSLMYACLNIATLGILGLTVNCSRSFKQLQAL